MERTVSPLRAPVARSAAEPAPRPSAARAILDLRPSSVAQAQFAQSIRSPPPAGPAQQVAPVQRIVIDGDKIDARAGEDNSLETYGYFDGAGDGIAQRVIDEYLERHPKAQFDHNGAWKNEIRLRTELIRSMTLIERLREDGHLSYNDANEWKLPADNWQTVKAQGAKKQDAAFRPAQGVSPLKAITELLQENDGEEVFYLDCSTAVLAAHYHALSVVLEEQRAGKFDQAFADPPMVIAPADVQGVSFGGGMVAPPGGDLTEDIPIKAVGGVEGLLPGDWVYFQNFTDYGARHAETAAYSGEHAIYAGGDNYIGFGAGTRSYKSMVAMLVTAYNDGVKKEFKKKADDREKSKDSLTGELPGIIQVSRALAPGRKKAGQ